MGSQIIHCTQPEEKINEKRNRKIKRVDQCKVQSLVGTKKQS